MTDAGAVYIDATDTSIVDMSRTDKTLAQLINNW